MNLRILVNSEKYKECNPRSLVLFKEICKERGVPITNLKEMCSKQKILFSLTSGENDIEVDLGNVKSFLIAFFEDKNDARAAYNSLYNELISYSPEILAWLKKEKEKAEEAIEIVEEEIPHGF